MNRSIIENYWQRVDQYLPVLNWVPNLRLVSVCNNLAFGKVDQESDIDLFVVARKGRLFTVRTFVTILLHLRGVRRYGDYIAGRFCLSFFIDDSALNMKRIALHHDIYLAYWIKSMKPVINDGVLTDILVANSWARDLFEEQKDFAGDNSKVFEKSFAAEIFKYIYLYTFDLVFGALLEWALKSWQMRRAQRKARGFGNFSGLMISESILKFHNIDRRSYYRQRWKKKYGREKLSDERFLAL